LPVDVTAISLGVHLKLFDCHCCGQTLFFENTKCESCGHRLGYDPVANDMFALERTEGELASLTWHVAGEPETRFKSCANAEYDVCNWLLPADAQDTYCLACRHNRTVPDLSKPENLDLWRQMEFAKHRLFYTLLQLKLPLKTRAEDPDEGLMFDFKADESETVKTLTGHDHGDITINIVEADDAEREKRRTAMHEPYRTLLGHFRHEIGHYYWDRLVRDAPALNPYRQIFGDERQDYNEALQKHYREGPPANWRDNYVSAYATTHSWEDFAETWAHYLHIIDTLDTADAFGIRIKPKEVSGADTLAAKVDFSPYTADSIDPIIRAWVPLTFAVNSLNRSMGLKDLYPFVLTSTIIEKLGFMHDLVHGWVGAERRAQPPIEPRPDVPKSDAA
jgi:hypothetical protein